MSYAIFPSMLSYTDLTPGTQFILDGEPYEVVDYAFVRMQQRKPSVQTKIRNLISGKIVAKTFQPSDTVKEADIERESIKFVYAHRNEYFFQKPDCSYQNSKSRSLRICLVCRSSEICSKYHQYWLSRLPCCRII